jgi:hypothetical protein
VPSAHAPKHRTPRPQANAESADAAVRSGVHFLDNCGRVNPRWRAYLDAGRLNMGDHRRDVLAQLGTNAEKLGLSLEQAVGFGFEPAEDDPEFAAHLTSAWRRHLDAYRSAVA